MTLPYLTPLPDPTLYYAYRESERKESDGGTWDRQEAYRWLKDNPANYMDVYIGEDQIYTVIYGENYGQSVSGERA